MAIIDIKLDPSKRELQVFGLLWWVFFLALARIAFAHQALLFGAASFTGTMFLIAFSLNRDYPKRTQLWGLLIPGLLWSMYVWDRVSPALGADWQVLTTGQLYAGAGAWLTWEGNRGQWLMCALLVGVAFAGLLLCLFSKRAGRTLYRTWMFAALPIGWTVSHLVLAVVYYLLLTPIGMLRRTLGSDPMTRSLDPSAASYWRSHTQQRDPGRYFRQF